MDRKQRIAMYKSLKSYVDPYEMDYIDTICDEHDDLTDKLNRANIETDTLRAELDAVRARNKHLEENLNAALVCATVGDTFKARQFMAKALSTEASES